MRVRTERVYVQNVTNPTTVAAHDLWRKVFEMTSVNEDAPENRADAHLMKDFRAEYGPWAQRRATGIRLLTEFYRTHFGADGGRLIEEYWYAKDRCIFTDENNPMRIRFREAQRKMRELHDGLIVDGYDIRRVTDQVLRDDEYSMFAIEV